MVYLKSSCVLTNAVVAVKTSMKSSVCFCVLFIFINFFHTTNASFLYGQPCSERNTAYLYPLTWRMPQKDVINCVDITGFKKHVGQHLNMTRYEYFFREATIADTLYADHMNLTRLPIKIIQSLPNLEMIDVSWNNIRRLPNKMIKIAPKMTKLLLANNKISIPKKKPLIGSPSLKTLMLSENGITAIYKYTFIKLPALEVLYLDSNNLRFISPLMFRSLKNLKYLHLGQNYLSVIPPKSQFPASLKDYIIKSQRKVKH